MAKKSRFTSARKQTVKTRFFDYGADPKAVRDALIEADDYNSEHDHILEEPKKLLIVRRDDQTKVSKKLLSSIVSDSYSMYHIGDIDYSDNTVISASFSRLDVETALVAESLHINKDPIRKYIKRWKQCKQEHRDKRIIIVLSLPEYIQALFRLHEYSAIIAPDGMIADKTSVVPTKGNMINIPTDNIALGDQHQEFISIDENGDMLVLNSENNGSATIRSDKPVESRGFKNWAKRFLKDTWLFYARILDLGYRFPVDENNIVYDPKKPLKAKKSRQNNNKRKNR